MGCSPSKLDNEAVIQLCKDRNKFIKQAVEYRMKFASGHIAYMQSMKRVSAALREYINSHEHHENMLLDYYKTESSTVKKMGAAVVFISPTSFSVTPSTYEPTSSCKINYLKSGGTPSISVEMRPPQSPETVRVEAYSPVYHFGIDSSTSSSNFCSSLNDRLTYSPISAQTSQWDFFWNPFSSLDYCGYPTSSHDETSLNDGNAGVSQVREKEGLCELEAKKEKEKETDEIMDKKEECLKADQNSHTEDVEVAKESCNSKNDSGMNSRSGIDQKGAQSDEIGSVQSVEAKKDENGAEMSSKEATVTDCELREETPGFTVHVNPRVTSMKEVIKDLEDQFLVANNSASEVSSFLQGRKANSSTSIDLTVMEMLNPVALFKSASSRSPSSSRFLGSFLTSRDDDNGSNTNFCEASCMFPGNHQSTLDRLYAWEKKLYHEVRAGERIRKAYEKKCSQLRNQNVDGEELPLSDKTRAAINDLHTQMKVSIHLVEAASKRIEKLRDEELEPQILELVNGLGRMWNVMAECHKSQKHRLDETKILLAGTSSAFPATMKQTMSPADLQRLADSAAKLESELRNWRACFETWVVYQRSYVHALTGWLLRCVRLDPSASKFPFSPRESFWGLSMLNICIHFSRLLDAIEEAPVLDGLDLAAKGVSLYAQQLQEESCKNQNASVRVGGTEVDQFEDVLTVQKILETASKVLSSGMSVAMNPVTEFAVTSAEGYDSLVKQCENAKQPESSDETGSSGTPSVAVD